MNFGILQIFFDVVKYWNLQRVNSDVVLLIDLWNFSNPSGSLFTGTCCDSPASTLNCSSLPPRCDVALKICVDSTENGLAIQIKNKKST